MYRLQFALTYLTSVSAAQRRYEARLSTKQTKICEFTYTNKFPLLVILDSRLYLNYKM